MSEESYTQLQPFIAIVPKPREEVKIVAIVPSIPEESIPVDVLVLDLNEADSTTLQKINGIGVVLSARIVKFRNGLGGFVSEDQLDEIYGIEEYALNNLRKETFILDEFIPNLLNINSMSIDQLGKHPYIRYSEAQQDWICYKTSRRRVGKKNSSLN